MNKHYWDYCGMCGPMVVCGSCGNNCCNGTYGKDGTCEFCPSAYDMQSTLNPPEFSPELIERIKQSKDSWEELELDNLLE